MRRSCRHAHSLSYAALPAYFSSFYKILGIILDYYYNVAIWQEAFVGIKKK